MFFHLHMQKMILTHLRIIQKIRVNLLVIYREKISKCFFDYCCVMHNTNQSQPLKISG